MSLAAGLHWSASTWLRWQVVSVGVALETPHMWTASSAVHLTHSDWFFKVGGVVGGDGGKTLGGGLVGLGRSFELGKQWMLDAGVQASVWPGQAWAVPVVAQVEVRYGF